MHFSEDPEDKSVGPYFERGMVICVLLVMVGLLGFVAFFSTQIDVPPPGSAPEPSVRELCTLPITESLTRVVIPEHYDIFYSISVTVQFDVQGTIKTTLTAKNATRCFVLHAGTNVAISEVELDGVEVQQYGRDDEFPDQVVFILTEQLHVDKQYVLRLKFHMPLSENLQGLYRSRYIDREGAPHWIASTDFEPADARLAFPCFDEPDLKASHQFTVEIDQQYTVLSNMPIQLQTSTPQPLSVELRQEVAKVGEAEIQEGQSTSLPVIPKRTVTFEKSPAMSTYLFALVMSDCFTQIMGNTKRGLPIGVWGAYPEELNFALQVAIASIEEFERRFGVDYALPKLDLVAIPNFSAGAMENWGLVTFRETALLIDENRSPSGSATSNRRRVATVIAHELAHQWFGNLVTTARWQDIWLNEGFASYYEYFGSEAAKPELNILDSFVYSDQSDAFSADMYGRKSHEIAVHRQLTDDEARGLFDHLTYKKGSSLLRMIDHWLQVKTNDKDAFNNALGYYLSQHKFGNVKTADLWAAVQSATKLDVPTMMNVWTYDKGFPVIRISHDPTDPTTIEIQQSWALPIFSRDDAVHEVWAVNVELLTDQNNHVQRFDLTLPLMEEKKPYVKWFKCNPNQVGFYLCEYPKDVWDELVNVMNDPVQRKALSVTDRAGLVDNAFHLVWMGRIKVHNAFRMTSYLTSEDNYEVWSIASSWFQRVRSLLGADTVLLLDRYVVKLLLPLVDQIGWNVTDKDSTNRKLVRSRLLYDLVNYLPIDDTDDYPPFIAAAQTLWESSYNDMHPDIRSAVYIAAVRYGEQEAYDQCWKRYRTSTSDTEKRRLQAAITQTNNVGLLTTTLDRCLDTTFVKTQDSMGFIELVLSNPIGRDTAWQFVKSNWATLFEIHGKSSFTLAYLLHAIARVFATDQLFAQFELFFEGEELGPAQSAFDEAKSLIQMNMILREQLELVEEGGTETKLVSFFKSQL